MNISARFLKATIAVTEKKRKSLSGKIKVGDSAEIFVNPQDPHDFFDMLGEDCLKSAQFNAIFSIVMGIGIFVMIILR